MTTRFDLPPLDGAVAPAFVSAADCKRWLSAQTLTNAGNFQQQLCEQIELLNRKAIDLRQRFDILEMLHPHVAFVQEEVSKRYASKSLPHLTAEAAAFAATIELWKAVSIGYLRCLEDAAAGAASGRTIATLVQCALATLHMMQIDRVRGFMQPDAQHWSRMHQLLAFAEDRDILTMPTLDETRYGEQAVTPLSIYVDAMFLHAVSASEFSTRSLQRVLRWARIWSGKVTLLKEAPPDLQAVPINVDLDSSQPPTFMPSKNASRARYLDTAGAASGIKACLAALAAGRSPLELKLGDDISKASCEVMLQRLYQYWCRGGMHRPADRAAATGTVDLMAGTESVWTHLAGRSFKQPRPSDEMLRRERDEIATFGHIMNRTEVIDKSKQHVESDWQIVNESPSGMRLMRSMSAHSLRLGIGSLLAVKKQEASSFTLASVRWMLLDYEGCLHIGLQLMSGVVTPISCRIGGLNAANELWRPAFLLQAGPEAAQVVVPALVFRLNRVIEVEGSPQLKKIKQFKLVKLIERSEEFERAEVE